MAAGGGPTLIRVDDRRLKVSNLDKVLYPEAGFTKGQVIDYYARVAEVMVPHVGDRGVTLRRFPDGVEGTSFFEKRCPSHRPDWVPVALGPGDRRGGIEYCRLDSRAALVWAANLAALEVHAPMARALDIEVPTMVVFDLDPGPGTGMAQCAEVGLWIRDVLAGLDLRCWPKTSGSKGLQLYLPVNDGALTHDQASAFALAVAQLLEKHHPELVVSNMKRDLRTGKVLVDWSQNSRHKTTAATYTLRAKARPTASTPVTWSEVAAAAEGAPLSFEAPEVLARIATHGDLFAPTLTVTQRLPSSRRTAGPAI